MQYIEISEDPMFTLYNVGSVLQRLFSTAEAIQYCGGMASVLRGEASVLRGEASVLRGKHQYCGGCSVLRRDSISTAGDSISTVEG